VPGDANFDRAVNFDDLVILSQHYTQTAQSWSTGDFTADGTVNFADLVILAQHYGTSGITSALTQVPGNATFATDWSLAQSLAPEPTLLLSTLTLTTISTRRRR
jgi:hypothetical protein